MDEQNSVIMSRHIAQHRRRLMRLMIRIAGYPTNLERHMWPEHIGLARLGDTPLGSYTAVKTPYTGNES